MMHLIYNLYAKHGTSILVAIYIKFCLRSSNKKIEWLKMCGMKVGEGVNINCNLSAFPEPFMIEIDDNVYIAASVQFLTHDGALS